MKKLVYLLILILGISTAAYSQIELTLENPTVRIENIEYHLSGFTAADNPIFRMTEYHDNNMVAQTGNLVNNKPDGLWQMFDKQGTLVAEMKFNNGDRVYLINYTSNGQSVIEYVNNKPYKQTQIAFLQ